MSNSDDKVAQAVEFENVNITAQKVKLSITDTADLVVFTEEIRSEKLHFLCSV